MKSKKPALIVLGAALAFGGAAVAAQQIDRAKQRAARSYRRWHTITVNRDIADVTMGNKALRPLLDLGDAIEVMITPAPGGKGTEIAAQLVSDDLTNKASREALGKLRVALRDTQWVMEAGEVLSPDKPSSTHKTLTSLPLQFAIRHAREGGRL